MLHDERPPEEIRQLAFLQGWVFDLFILKKERDKALSVDEEDQEQVFDEDFVVYDNDDPETISGSDDDEPEPTPNSSRVLVPQVTSASTSPASTSYPIIDQTKKGYRRGFSAAEIARMNEIFAITTTPDKQTIESLVAEFSKRISINYSQIYKRFTYMRAHPTKQKRKRIVEDSDDEWSEEDE